MSKIRTARRSGKRIGHTLMVQERHLASHSPYAREGLRPRKTKDIVPRQNLQKRKG